MPRITKRTVDALLPHERERVVWDHDIKGFGVRVHPSGRKVFIVKTRYRGRAIKMTIGSHGAVSAHYARKRAAEIIIDARAGKDPKIRKSNAPTMRALGKRFLEEYVPLHCRQSTAAEYRRSVELFINPRIGKLRVPDIQRSDVAALHHDLQETPYQANRTLGVLSKMFSLAELWDIRPDGSNPCRHVKRYKEEKRERSLSDAEYQRLGEALREIEREGSETEAAIAVLKGIARSDENPWVIAGRKPGSRLTDLQHPWRRVRARAGLDDVRIHDLRHSFASGGLLVGEGLPMIGKLLGHTQVQTTARYAHLANDPIKSAANRIASRISKVTG